MLTIKEILAKITGHETAIAALTAAPSQATISVLTNLSSDVSALKTSTVAALEKAESDLTAEKSAHVATAGNLTSANSAISAIAGELRAACKAMALEVAADASNSAMITSMQGAVASTLSKLQVDASKVPAGKPTTASGMPDKALTETERCIAANKSANPGK